MSAPEPLTLHCDTRGEGPGVVLVHGLYGSGTNFRRHAAWLAEQYRVLSPDLRNHGRSPHSAEMSYPAMAADLAALLDREGLAEATLVGHSMGGKAAMALALTRPQRVSALVVVDIAPVAYDHDQGAILEAMEAVDLEQVASRGDADRQLRDAVPEAGVRQFLLTNLERADGAWRWRLPLGILARAMPSILDFPELGSPYPGPALFLHGAASDYVQPRHQETIRRRFPEARLQALEGVGHWVHAEAPDAFETALREFLGQVPPATGRTD